VEQELTRRAFLLASAGVAAAATLLGRLGQPSAPPDQTLKLGELSLQVMARPFRLALRGPDAGLIWQQPADGGLAFETADGARYGPTELVSMTGLGDGAAQLAAATSDPSGRRLVLEVRSLGPRAVRLTITPSVVDGVTPPAEGQSVVAVGGSILAAPDERFVGLGERFDGVDQRGRVVDVWARDRRLADYGPSTYAPVPLVWSSRGYGVTLERPERASFDFAASDVNRWEWRQEAPSASLVLSYGPSLKELLQEHVRRTGLPPLPPIWAFGVWKVAVGGTEQVLTEMQRLRQLGVPVSAAFVFDARDDAANIGWPTVNFQGRHAGTYSDLPGFTHALHGLGLKALNYLTADFHLDRDSYREPASHGFFVKRADGRPYVHEQFQLSWLDFTDPDAVDWWQRLWRKALVGDGFDGGMLDLGELIPEDAYFADGTTGAETHNRYPALYAQAAWESASAVKPDGDFALLVRAAALGAQRFHSLQWPGDPRMRWEAPDGLQSMLPAALSFGLSGFPYWCAEVAGYVQVGLTPDQERELWLRWLQLGTWTATLRDHYGDHPTAPIDAWRDPGTMAAFRDAARLHSSLVPYLYSCAAEASRTGLPLIRALALEVPDDPRAWQEETSYFLGPLLLVAPVLQPGVTSRTVYLPAGAWVDFWTSQVYAGGQEVSVPAPLDGGRVPVFGRAGALLPLAPPYDSLVSATDPSVKTYAGDLVVRLLAGGSPPAEFVLYDGTRLAWDGRSLQVSDNARPRSVELDLPDGRSGTARIDGRTGAVAVSGA
jgi:alpha-D-xyloside xylohydrolase